MQGYKYNQIMNPFFDMPTDYKEAVKVYKTLAKTADQRLVRLEAASHEEGFRGIKQYAYSRAVRDIEAWDGTAKDKPRFNTKAPESMQQLLEKIEDIKTFLSSETSTKSGMIAINKRRVATINEKYGTNLTWKDLNEVFGDGSISEELDDTFAGSDSKIETVANLKKNKKKILKAIDDAKKKHQKIDVDISVKDASGKPDKVIEEKIKEMIANYPQEVREYLEG